MAKKGSDLLGEAAHDRLTFIDIGANTGCFTLMALDPPALRVLALEAKKNLKSTFYSDLIYEMSLGTDVGGYANR